MSGAAVGSYLDPSLGHQECAVVHFRHRQDILRFGEADPRRYARFTALWGEVEGGDLDERISRRQHTCISHVIGFGHWGVDLKRERHRIASWEGPRHRTVKPIRFRWNHSGP